jgi:hypothetical protein
MFDIDDEVDIDNDLRSRRHLGPGQDQATHPVQHLASGLGPEPEDQQLGISVGEQTDRVGEARLPLHGAAHILHRVSEPLDRL